MHLILLLLVCCTSKKNIVENNTDVPSWIENFPISQSHYVGIGLADKNKNPVDFIKVAQKNALQNLISQIKVNLSSESYMISMEREYGFKKDVKSIIKVKAEDIIEGYELVGTYTKDNEYWAYYRLNKALYKEIKNKKIQAAIKESKFFLNKAILDTTSLKNKYIYYVSALKVLEPYFSESLTTEFNNKNVNLFNEIITRFRSYINGYELYLSSETINNSLENVPTKINITVEHNKLIAPNIELFSSSESLNIKPISNETDQNGIQIISIENFKTISEFHSIRTDINFNNWLKETNSSDLINEIFEKINGRTLNSTVKAIVPNIFVKSIERHYGIENDHHDLKLEIESALSSLGLKTVSEEKKAALVMTVNSLTEKGNQINGQKMFTSFLKMTIQVKDKKNNTIFSKRIDNIKGIQLSYDKADKDAYLKASKSINNEVIPDFVKSLTGQ